MKRLPITFNATLAGAVRRRDARALRRLKQLATECGMDEREFSSRACKNISPSELDELLAHDQPEGT